jgi:hypothetical protein
VTAAPTTRPAPKRARPFPFAGSGLDGEGDGGASVGGVHVADGSAGRSGGETGGEAGGVNSGSMAIMLGSSGQRKVRVR